ncbi:MAG: 4a-hydroxytetrahydrobiopterin dehydratase [Bacteroidota bacterium]|nr:4a-hydroxytetrahydrobiopterin dehydratase [Candidatus Kapabacteria bacterium]MDW8220589.1 4a-hydroxytetrahydrobiopterin dehydratase [Bacteroidota bacterium]
MPRPSLLSESQVREMLSSVPHWEHVGASLQRTFTFPTFLHAMGFVNAVAIAAEAADHHPDIAIFGWNKVRLTLSTHDRGGLTELDFALASKIDTLQP